MSLKDRRNQRKLENTDESTINESDKVTEQIDKIKEEAHQLTKNSQHLERQKSRARAFSKKLQRGVVAIGTTY